MPEPKPIVLVVDDTADNIALMTSLLRDDYRVKAASSGERALEIAARDPKPDLILLDVMMPGLDGYAVCARLKADPAAADIPVIFLTAKTQPQDEQNGFALGAVDYIAKPISPPVVLARVKTHLLLKNARDFLKDRNAFLQAEIRRRTQELTAFQDVTIAAMASLAETRDNETGNHIKRTQLYVKILAERLRDSPRFAAQLSPDDVELIYKSAPLHDIGKVGVPDRILLKPGRLNDHEFEIMQRHTTLGKEAIEAAEARLEAPNSFLRIAKEIAYSHQEKWDGTGYPLGLAGEDIPLSARLMAAADVYDALISRRIYKPPFPHEVSVKIMIDGRGKHFDPAVLDAFLECQTAFLDVARGLADSQESVEEKAAQLSGWDHMTREASIGRR